jgi:hypothetical protein
MPDTRHSFVTPRCLKKCGIIIGCAHGPELEDAECFVVITVARLAVKDRTARVELYGDRYDYEKGKENDEKGGGKREIECPLQKLVRN